VRDIIVIAWIDATGGIAGDMLLGALLDAGADLLSVQQAVDAVLPGAVRLAVDEVTRAGTRACQVNVEVMVDDPPHRHWSGIRERIETANLAESVRAKALSTFTLLATAEGRVHSIPADDVHFHEVGAIDSIADIVGVCAAIEDLGITSIIGSPAAVGAGRMRVAHGDMAIPGPAVTELLRGWPITAGGPGELTTPTGAALLVGLTAAAGPIPPMVLRRTGIGAGSRDDPHRANVTRVLVGEPVTAGAAGDDGNSEDAILLEANVDDMDPRIWPTVVTALLDAGAADAWLVPVAMKKGRPGHILSVLADPMKASALRTMILAHTTSFGVRQTSVRKFPAARGWIDVPIDDAVIPIKIAHAEGRIVRATPEFEDVADLAAQRGEPVLTVLDLARTAADNAGLRSGAAVPGGLNPARTNQAARTESPYRERGDAP
jgi:uncharacterized protein (TIGR00299 family) protein